MTQAPAATPATAVRQHGGGHHPLNLPCTAPAGRLHDSRGGVIDRRAKGATSSNTLPASCAAAAHPTTGVRRARELSPSLRSQSCQHAQLVKGYKGLPVQAYFEKPLHGKNQYIDFVRHSRERPVVLAIRFVVSNGCHQISEVTYQLKKRRSSFSISKPSCIERLCLTEKGSQPIGCLGPVAILSDHFENQLKAFCSPRYVLGDFCRNRKADFLRLQTLTVCSPISLSGDPDRSQNCQDGADSLHPSSSRLRPNNEENRYSGNGAQRYPEHHCTPGESRHVSIKEVVRHRRRLATSKAPSLPAPCHDVQRGAA